MEVNTKVIEHPSAPDSNEKRELVINMNNTDNMKNVECDSVIDPNSVKENVSEVMQELALHLSGAPAESGEKAEQQVANTDGIPSEADIEAEVTRIKNELVASLIQYDGNFWSCKACLHECSLPHRMRDHILNRHFNSPLENARIAKYTARTTPLSRSTFIDNINLRRK